MFYVLWLFSTNILILKITFKNVLFTTTTPNPTTTTNTTTTTALYSTVDLPYIVKYLLVV